MGLWVRSKKSGKRIPFLLSRSLWRGCSCRGGSDSVALDICISIRTARRIIKVRRLRHLKSNEDKNMKSKIPKLSLVLVAIAGVVFALRSQPSAPIASKAYDTYGNDGRYRLVIAPNG